MITSSTSQDYTILEYTSQINPSPFVMMERSPSIKWKPKNNIELAPNCPRCASSNTKFCYYNNYSLSQPRYFCKACRRYWTKGGTLRNVPVGGGCRKTRRTRPPRSDGGPDYLGATTPGLEHVGPTISFSKYVEQNVGNDESSSSRASIVSCDHKVGGSWLEPLDLIDGADDRLQSRVDEFIYGQDFVCQNYDDFEMEGVFGGELAGDMLWEEGLNLPSFGAQQPAALQNMQDLDIFSTSDNWSPFDLSGYEIFSRN